ncbi:MAG: hypothetical protein IT289_07425 [Oligoflexia bacterium]|nr:hypothetical protein [Oligoflexia bacterium]
MASSLQSLSVVRERRTLMSKVRGFAQEIDMALYDRGSGIGFVYSNFSDLVRKVQASGVTSKISLFHEGLAQKNPELKTDSLVELKENMNKLQDMHQRLQFMLSELEGLVKKG